MTTKPTGGSAFPQPIGIGPAGDVMTPGQYFTDSDGLTKREWFAGMAIQGMLAAHASNIFEDVMDVDIEQKAAVVNATLAEMAYGIADAMISEGQK